MDWTIPTASVLDWRTVAVLLIGVGFSLVPYALSAAGIAMPRPVLAIVGFLSAACILFPALTLLYAWHEQALGRTQMTMPIWVLVMSGASSLMFAWWIDAHRRFVGVAEQQGPARDEQRRALSELLDRANRLLPRIRDDHWWSAMRMFLFKGRARRTIGHFRPLDLPLFDTCDRPGMGLRIRLECYQERIAKIYGSSPESVTVVGAPHSNGRCSRCRSRESGSRTRDG